MRFCDGNNKTKNKTLTQAFFGADGKLLVKEERRMSLTLEISLPGGGIEKEFVDKSLDERIIAQELARKVMRNWN